MKEGWKKTWKNTESDKHNTGVFCNEITKWSKWKIHKKETKNREWIKEEKKNNQETEKKEDHPKKRSKKYILSNAEEVKK